MKGGNPYAAPVTATSGVPDAPNPYGWELLGKRIWVKDSAQFPMVDPYSGGSEEVMTLNRLTIRLKPFWTTFLIWFGIALCYLSTSVVIAPQWKDTSAIVGLLVVIGCLIGRNFFPLTSLRIFFTARTLRIRRIQQWIINGCFLIAMVSGWDLRPLEKLIDRETLDLISAVALGSWCLGLIWIFLVRRKLVCRRHKDGRFEIRGFHPNALKLLATKQAGEVGQD